MSHGVQVSQAPSKPLLVYDGDCHFCGLWIRRWRQWTGDAVEYLPAQDPRIAEQFPEIPPTAFDTAVQLITPAGIVYSGAEAVFRSLAGNPAWGWLLRGYEDFPLFARLSEWAYRLVAEHRPLFSRLTRWGWGQQVEVPSYFLVRWLFLRGLGLVYLFAFISLWMQVDGLIGHNGILPAGQYMDGLKQECVQHNIGIERFHLLPTLCWFNASDTFLHFQCMAGTVLSILLIAGIAPVPCLTLLWLFYLSLSVVGRDFFGFQWDCLLLEAGLLAIFLAPWQLLPRPSRTPPPSRLFIWLVRLLVFKLMLSSGCVKLLSGDPNWCNLTALTFHYQTQPLPPWTAWYANQLPLWFQKMSCLATLVIEIGAPWLIFAPRRIRFMGAGMLIGLQVLIMVSGNYTFFNWLAIVLCLVLLDDFTLKKCVPSGFYNRFGSEPALPGRISIRWPFPLLAMVAAVVFAASSYMLAATLGWRSPVLAPFGWVAEEIRPFRSVNNYGLFAVMTTQRNEIIVEGSNDGVNWLAYEFKYKPGDAARRPAFVAPLQPRLDWQMWFAAFGSYRDNPWLESFCERLLQGSPDVLTLLAKNPFPQKPPKFIRAEFYNYRFTTPEERRKTGDWWQRQYLGDYMPAVSLRE